jgi:hypothetical protein
LLSIGKDFFKKNCCGIYLRKITELFGGAMLFFFVVVSLYILLITLYLCWENGTGYEIISSLLLSKLWSFGEWFPYTLPYFSWKYEKDKKYYYQIIQEKKEKKNKDNNKISSSSIENDS